MSAPRSGYTMLLATVLRTTAERHEDMRNLVTGLPEGALHWRPAPEAASLADLVFHIAALEGAVARIAAGSQEPWELGNGAGMGQDGGLRELLEVLARAAAAIEEALKDVYEEAFIETVPGGERTIGEMIVEELDHAAMHYGQLQLTRHLWEEAHPAWDRTYLHWR
jgi:DinB superfamily